MAGGRNGGRVFLEPRGAEEISFIEDEHGLSGIGAHQRCWHITRAVTGWRLEFHDPGDDQHTFAGVHGSLAEAKREASW